MSHWLEKAEDTISQKKEKKEAIKDRIEIKKEDIKENRALIEDEYRKILDQFFSILERINNLPRRDRIPFGNIHSKQKENKLNNLLYKFHSSRRQSIHELNSLLKPFKNQHYKNSRSIFISIDRKKNHVLIEYKEIKAKKIRINEEKPSLMNKIFFLNKSRNKSNHLVNDMVKNIAIHRFTESYIMAHIDWLAFKREDLRFIEMT